MLFPSALATDVPLRVSTLLISKRQPRDEERFDY